MNGEIGQNFSGTAMSVPEIQPEIGTNNDIASLNGTEEMPEGFMSPTSGLSPIPINLNNDTQSIPIEQLKQMLSSQLEYYFSR